MLKDIRYPLKKNRIMYLDIKEDEDTNLVSTSLIDFFQKPFYRRDYKKYNITDNLSISTDNSYFNEVVYHLCLNYYHIDSELYPNTKAGIKEAMSYLIISNNTQNKLKIDKNRLNCIDYESFIYMEKFFKEILKGKLFKEMFIYARNRNDGYFYNKPFYYESSKKDIFSFIRKEDLNEVINEDYYSTSFLIKKTLLSAFRWTSFIRGLGYNKISKKFIENNTELFIDILRNYNLNNKRHATLTSIEETIKIISKVEKDKVRIIVNYLSSLLRNKMNGICLEHFSSYREIFLKGDALEKNRYKEPIKILLDENFQNMNLREKYLSKEFNDNKEFFIKSFFVSDILGDTERNFSISSFESLFNTTEVLDKEEQKIFLKDCSSFIFNRYFTNFDIKIFVENFEDYDLLPHDEKINFLSMLGMYTEGRFKKQIRKLTIMKTFR